MVPELYCFIIMDVECVFISDKINFFLPLSPKITLVIWEHLFFLMNFRISLSSYKSTVGIDEWYDSDNTWVAVTFLY